MDVLFSFSPFFLSSGHRWKEEGKGDQRLEEEEDYE